MSADALAVRRSLTNPRHLCEALGLLRGYKPGRQRHGGLLIRCPSHGDNNPSCSVRIGPDGTLQVHCFVCDFSGDALTLVAAALGLDVRRDFPRIIELAAHIAGGVASVPRVRHLRPNATEVPYPTQSEVDALWETCVPVEQDEQASAYLRSRAIDPALVDHLGLARALPHGALTPRWARFSGKPWSLSGHRLLFPMLDAHGVLRSLRASLLAPPSNDTPKRVAPAGKNTAGLVLASPLAHALLSTDSTTPPDVLITEGEFDFLTWATRLHTPGSPAVFGVVTCAWSHALAARIPDHARLFLRTHQDQAGDKYAADIRESLSERPITFFDFPHRGQPRSRSAPDDNDLAQLGHLPTFDIHLVSAEDLDDAPASAVRPKLSPPLLSAAEATTVLADALRSDDSLLVARSTPGVGKSALERQALREHTASSARALVSVSSLDLADQTVDELRKLGVPAFAPRGVARVRLPLVNSSNDPRQACLHAEAADLLAQSNVSVRKTLCTHCPARKAHPATGGDCPAYKSGDPKAPVTVVQQPVLASLLAEHTHRLLHPAPDTPPDAQPATLAVLDERIAPTTTTDLTGALGAFHSLEGELRANAREYIAPLLLAVLAGAPLAPSGSSLRQLAAAGGLQDNDFDDALYEARSLDDQDLWSGGFLHSLSRLATLQPCHATRTKLQLLARVTALVEALVDAAHDPDRPSLWTDEAGSHRLITAARWTRRVVPYIEAGGKIRYLDATASEDELRSLWGDHFRILNVDVVDAPDVVRRCKVWQHAARGRHTHADGTPIAEQVRGPLRTVAKVALEHEAKSVALITDKPLADALRCWLDAPKGSPRPALVPKELAALVASGVELRVRHYGHQRGLDALADADLLVTLGDPWPHLGEARAQARSLGLDPERYALEQARAELLQAWGRARTVHRTTPVLILHLGSRALQPDASWAPQWAGIAPSESRRGRSRTVEPASNPASWAAERERLGLSAREHAKSLGLAWGTYCRLAKQALGVTPKTIEQNGGPQMGTASFSGVSFVLSPGGDSSLNSHLWASQNPQELGATAPSMGPGALSPERASVPRLVAVAPPSHLQGLAAAGGQEASPGVLDRQKRAGCSALLRAG